MGCTEAMSSGSVRVVGLPTGFRETASAAAWRRPGMWVTRNLYRSDFSLRLRRRGFGMASRQRSPNSFTRGLWSTATMRSVQPRVK